MNKQNQDINSIIPPSHFFAQLRKLALLTNTPPPSQEQLEALYEYLMYSDINDFNKAINYMAFNDVRITLANLKKHISHYECVRLEAEHERLKKQEADEVYKLINNTPACEGGACKDCNHFINCIEIKNAHLRCVLDILNREDNIDVIIKRYANKYKGAGFEQLEKS